MTTEFFNFDAISREKWQQLYRNTLPQLTSDELESIKSLNDQISIQDVNDIYLPLINLIQIYQKNTDDLRFSKSLFLQKPIKKSPFIIGISGSVAVGKSTTSRLLKILLSRTFEKTTVELMTTDGFLYPNATLTRKGLMDQKGFPDSYDMELLLNSLDQIKNGQKTSIPIYSHESYDILSSQKQTIDCPDFLIVEGINVFQSPQNSRLLINDYFDFSIYVDANAKHIENWYLERFDTLLKLAKNNPQNYYFQFTKMDSQKAFQIAQETWSTINLKNLKSYIEPTRNRADIILHKQENHKIDKILLKK